MAGFSFNASGIQLDTPRQPVPDGTYVARIIESEIKLLKSGNGEGLSLVYEIIEGPYATRRIWQNLNVRHTSQNAQVMAQQQLAGICHAVGMPNGFNETHELHNKPLKIRVKIRKDDHYGDKNEISGTSSIGQPAIPAVPVGTQQPAANAAPAAPWAKRA